MRLASESVPRHAAPDVESVLASLERLGTKATRDGMARFGIVAPKAFGVRMGPIQSLAKSLGRSQALAEALWRTGWYEARLLCAFVGEPQHLTIATMDSWVRDFDNWAVCDTLAFHLFDRSPLAHGRIAPWARRREEFVRRAGFALLASLALHDKRAPDAAFLRHLPLIERTAGDERNFVKKGVSWALRGLGGRNPALNAEAIAVARRLTDSEAPPARWIGRDALRELTGPTVQRRLKKR